jgi:Ni,Fe-hydrogenase I large subunit
LLIEEEAKREEEEAEEARKEAEKEKKKAEVVDDDQQPKEKQEETIKAVVSLEDAAKAEKAKNAEKRIKDEGVLTGRVKLMAYSRYLEAIGWLTSAAILTLFVANQAVSSGSTVWLAAWSNHNKEAAETGGEFNNGLYLGVLGIFGIVQGVLR